MEKMNRRDFIRFAGGVTVSSFVVPDALFANSGGDLPNDFKALVVVDLQGGNDALNMFIPTDKSSGSDIGYEKYAKARTDAVRIKDNDLMGDLRARVDSNGYLDLSASGAPYNENNNLEASYTKGYYLLDKNGFESKVGVNAMMPEVAYWLDRGKGAIVQNVGSIAQPATKDDLLSGRLPSPPFNFAHDQQATLMKTGQASSINIPTGWLGRVADKWSDLFTGGAYKMNINLSTYGQYKMFFGNETMPMSYSSKGPVDYGDSYLGWYDGSNRTYLRTSRLALRKEMADMNDGDMFRKLSASTEKAIIEQVEQTVADWDSVSGENNIFDGLTDSYGNSFVQSDGETTLIPSTTQLNIGNVRFRSIDPFMTAAKLIHIGKNKGFKRMVIAITLGGYDQHSTQSTTHSAKIRELSLGVDRLMRFMEAKGYMDSVTMFTVSEFARTLGSNSNGTDHAWGGAYMVLGGAVRSGNYGTFPSLTLGGADDLGDKGRFVPTTSYSQYFGTILKWFGADAEVLDHALPELKNFSTKDLGFMG